MTVVDVLAVQGGEGVRPGGPTPLILFPGPPCSASPSTMRLVVVPREKIYIGSGTIEIAIIPVTCRLPPKSMQNLRVGHRIAPPGCHRRAAGEDRARAHPR